MELGEVLVGVGMGVLVAPIVALLLIALLRRATINNPIQNSTYPTTDDPDRIVTAIPDETWQS